MGAQESGEHAGSPACPVCAREDALPVRHGLRSDRRSSVEADGYWWSGRCLGPGRERWHCRGCGCEWPPSTYRFHVFVDVYAADHASARSGLSRLLHAGPDLEHVEIDAGPVGNALGFDDENAHEDVWERDG